MAAAPNHDPVSTTGPRMLEYAIDHWHMAHPSADIVRVLPPAVFYPEWDPIRRGVFREKCAALAQPEAPEDSEVTRDARNIKEPTRRRAI